MTTETTFQTTLDGFREEIDRIDDELVRLIRERCGIVQQVGALKGNHGVTGSYIRPRREALMLRRMITAFGDSPFPPQAAAAIWRTLIGASCAMESPLQLAVYCPHGKPEAYYAAREYFGAFVPAISHEDPEEAIDSVIEDPHIVGVFPLPLEGMAADIAPWWLHLALRGEGRPLVFAAVPFLLAANTQRSGVAPQVAVGQVELHATDRDQSFFVLRFEFDEVMNPEQRSQMMTHWCKAALEGAGLSSRFLLADGMQAAMLLVLDGFYPEDSEGFTVLKQQCENFAGKQFYGMDWIGACASPEIV